MNHYKHAKGIIRDNSLKAIVTDPLFHKRIEQNQKGKGSYRRKDKHAGKAGWEVSDKYATYH